MIKKEIGKLFPNSNNTVAFYSPTSFCITLNKITEAECKNLFSGKMDRSIADNLGVLYHEMRHYVDHIATLWGQRNIKLLGEALDARLQMDEKQFWKIVSLKSHERQREFATYYTEHYNTIPWTKTQGNWKYEFSTGIRFDVKGNPDDTKPIMFLKFSTFDGLPLVRVPLSISSLLETNAIREEFTIVGSYINSLPEEERLVEGSIFSSNTFQGTIYNQKLVLYNVAVHLTANLLDLTDLTTSLNISSAIATLTLNLPDSLLGSIPISESDRLTWGDRPTHLVNNFEYGYIFYALLVNYKSVFKQIPKFDLSSLLAANNLPSEEEIEKIVLQELKEINNGFDGLVNLKGNLQKITKHGAELFLQHGLDGSKSTMTQLITDCGLKPNVLCSDTDFPFMYNDIADIFRNRPIDNLTPAQWYNFAFLMDTKMEEFFEVRGL